MPILFAIFFCLLALFPYALCFALLMLPRLLPPLGNIRRRNYILGALGISIAVNVTATILGKHNPFCYVNHVFGDLLYTLFMLSPLWLAALFAAVAVNLGQLFTNSPRFRIKPRRTVLAAVLAPLLVIGCIAVHCASLTVTVPAEYRDVVGTQVLDEIKSSALAYGKHRLTFPLSVRIVRAGEDFYDAHVTYFIHGRTLGISSDGLYQPY